MQVDLLPEGANSALLTPVTVSGLPSNLDREARSPTDGWFDWSSNLVELQRITNSRSIH